MYVSPKKRYEAHFPCILSQNCTKSIAELEQIDNLVQPSTNTLLTRPVKDIEWALSVKNKDITEKYENVTLICPSLYKVHTLINVNRCTRYHFSVTMYPTPFRSNRKTTMPKYRKKHRKKKAPGNPRTTSKSTSSVTFNEKMEYASVYITTVPLVDEEPIPK